MKGCVREGSAAARTLCKWQGTRFYHRDRLDHCARNKRDNEVRMRLFVSATPTHHCGAEYVCNSLDT